MASRRALLLFFAGCKFHSGTSARVDAIGIDTLGDADIDAPPDAFDPLCFGPSPFTVCLPALPTSPVTIPPATDIISNVTGNKCNSGASDVLMMNGQRVCVVAGTSITTTGNVGSYGTLPIVLVAIDTITITGLLDARASNGGTGGPGENPLVCGDLTTMNGAPSSLGAGGGAGGSFGSSGGNGGAGNSGNSNAGVAKSAQVPPVTTLRGGCPGGHGGLASNGNANGGDGGGALYLVTRGTISITGTITVSGGGGAGGKSRGGGAGGGSGGMLVLAAPTLTIDPSSLLFANGGGGGAGGGATVDGSNGSDALVLGAPASGGGVGDLAATPGGAGAFQSTAAGSATQATAGGGGGGGGVGVIRVLSGQSIPTANVSPPPT